MLWDCGIDADSYFAFVERTDWTALRIVLPASLPPRDKRRTEAAGSLSPRRLTIARTLQIKGQWSSVNFEIMPDTKFLVYSVLYVWCFPVASRSTIMLAIVRQSALPGVQGGDRILDLFDIRFTTMLYLMLFFLLFLVVFKNVEQHLKLTRYHKKNFQISVVIL